MTPPRKNIKMVINSLYSLRRESNVGGTKDCFGPSLVLAPLTLIVIGDVGGSLVCVMPGVGWGDPEFSCVDIGLPVNECFEFLS